MNFRRRARAMALAALLLAAVSLASPPARAGSGLLGLDHYVREDDRGIWARRNQLLLIDAMLAGESVVALWEGGGTRLGRTLWKSIDATVVGGVAAAGLKLVFSRARPRESSNPNQWFQGGGHASFPSGEVAIVSAIVTPLVLEYRHDHAAVYALELLPLYDAIARVKVHGHWQSDVLAGYALGSAAGYFMGRRARTPVVLSVMPHSVYIGLRHSF
jgi:acid phosphatase family membrane protein YuiD